MCAFPLYLTPRLEAAPDSNVDPVVRAAQAGDADAFASLYDAHVSRVYALCLGLAGNREEAAELVQDTFVRAWERLHTFRGECALSTWLHRVAVNITLEARRSLRRRSLRVAIESDLASPAGGDVIERDVPASCADVALVMDLETAIAPSAARNAGSMKRSGHDQP